jgi:hypothetical protein
MIMSIEDKVMENSLHMPSGDGLGMNSELMNQQINEVRIDKNILMERLNIAETARFELQKGVDTMRENISQNRDHFDGQYDQQKKVITDLRIEMDGQKDKEIVKNTILTEKESKLEETLKSLHEDREKVTYLF